MALVRKTALNIDKNVVMATPVDTGRARGNWQVNLNGPAQGEVENPDPTGQMALTQGASVIATSKAGDSIHITNNLPYINRLNEGYSAQAPANFVEQAVRSAASFLRNYRLLKDPL